MDGLSRLGGANSTELDEANREVGERGRKGVGRLKLLENIRQHLWPASIVTLALIILLAGVYLGDHPGGADSWGHLAKAEYLSEQVRAEGLGSYFTSAWLPTWYLGDPFRTYYPPLALLTLTPIILITGDAFSAYSLYVSLILVLLAVFTYLFFNRQWGKWPAVLGTVIVVSTPYQLRTIFFEGNTPRALSLLALPIIALATEELLSSKHKRAPWIGVLALSWLWALLAHPQQAYLYAIGFVVYLIVRLFLDVRIPLTQGGFWVIGLALGLLLAAPWLVPAYSGGELSEVPFLPAEKVDLFSAPLTGLFPGFNAWDGRVLFGTGAIFLAILAVVARPEPRRNAWLVSGLLAVWLSLGPSGVVFSLLPLNLQLLPERFINFSAFAFASAAAGLLPMVNKTRLLRAIIIVGFVGLDFIPSLSLLSGRSYPVEQAGMQALIPTVVPDGSRLALMTYPEPISQEVYFAGKRVNLINGWALENTTHNQVLRRVLDVPTWSEAYLEHLFSAWSVNYAVVRGAKEPVENVRHALASAGFSTDGRTSYGYQVWENPSASSPVQLIPPSRMLALGDQLQPMFMAFPFAEEAEPPRLSDLPQGSLEKYAALALYRFEESDSELSESALRIQAYVEQGGTVIVDLSGMEETFGRSLDFLDVDVLRLSVLGNARLDWEVDLGDLPDALDLSEVSPDGWSGATYSGLDGVIASVEVNGKWYPFVGYRDFGAGRAWFVGFNLFYYAQLSGEQEMVSALSDHFLKESPVSRALRFEPVPIKNWEVNSHGLSFVANPVEPVDEALISYTYSPRWRISIDGEEIPFSSFEKMLKIKLPAGEHEVRVAYNLFETQWPRYGLAGGVIGLILLGAVFGAETVYRRTGRGSESVDEDPKPIEHAPCPNCQFLLAEVNIPTRATYPFKAVSCPICGLRIDDEGIVEGKKLSEEERKVYLARWLDRYQYDIDKLEEKGGLGYQDYFFEGEIEDYFEKHYGDHEDEH
jgi:hypothetical protein